MEQIQYNCYTCMDGKASRWQCPECGRSINEASAAVPQLGEATTEKAASAADEYIRVLEEYWGIPSRVNDYNNPVTSKAREAYLAERASYEMRRRKEERK